MNKIASGLAVLLITLVAGCGGGGGGSSSGGGSGGSTSTLSGTAASGLPVAGKAISIKDADGKTALATTKSDGTYSFDVTSMTAPFLLQVPNPAGGSLYGVATSSGTANVHPLTDMIVRNWFTVQGTDADTAYGTTGAMPNPPTAQAIATIEAVVRQIVATYIQGADVNPNGFNLITTPFNANHSGFDLVLDNLTVTGGTKITATGGSTILDVTAGTDLTTVTPPPAPVSDAVAPSVPGTITANRTGLSQVVVSWVASTDNLGGSGVAGYKVYQNGTQVGITDQPFFVAGAAPATSACYTVAAFDAAGNKSAQNTEVCASDVSGVADTTPPTAPGNPVASAFSSTQIDLSWNAATDAGGIAGYRVLVGGAAIASLPATATSYSHTGLNGNTQYSYVVVAIDTSGNATPSALASATTLVPADTTPPSTPTSLAATAASYSQIDLSWTASTDNAGGSGVAGYKVYAGSSASVIGTSTTTSFSAVGLSSSTQYCYSVAAYDNDGNVSAATAQKCATTAPGVAQKLAGFWYAHNYYDGVRQDGTLDFLPEYDETHTVTINADGSWTVAVATVSPGTGTATLVFPATAVTIDEAANTVTLKDADGLGRSILVYNPTTNTIKAQWQKLAPDGVTWWANYETWGSTRTTPPAPSSSIVGSWLFDCTLTTGLANPSRNLCTFTFMANGEYVMTQDYVNVTGTQQPGGMERGTYTWNPVTGAFNSLCPTVDTNGEAGLSHPVPGVCSGTTDTATISGNNLTFLNAGVSMSRLSDPTNPAVGAWALVSTTTPAGPFDPQVQELMVILPDGQYIQASSGPSVNGQDGIEHGTAMWDSVTGGFSTTCPTIDTNGARGPSSIYAPSCGISAAMGVTSTLTDINANIMSLPNVLINATPTTVTMTLARIGM